MSFNYEGRTRTSSVNRWVVFAVICSVTALDFGIIFTLGAMFVAMIESYQADRSSTATVQSLLVGISLSFSVISGLLISAVGVRKVTLISSLLVPLGFCISYFVKEIRHLYITISVISGIGISLVHVTGVVVVQHAFPQSLHPLCFALHGTGVNLAGIIYPLLISLLLYKYGVQGCFLVLGGIFLNTFVLFFVLSGDVVPKGENDADTAGDEEHSEDTQHKHIPEETNCSQKQSTSGQHLTTNRLNGSGAVNDTLDDEEEDRDDEAKVEDALTNKPRKSKYLIERIRDSSIATNQYIFLLIASALCIPVLNTSIGLIVDIFLWKGFTVSQGLVSFVPFNVFSIISKFIPVLAKKFLNRVSCFTLPIVFCILGFVSQLLMWLTDNYILMLVGASLMGLALGGVFPAMLIAGAKIVNKEEWPVASGLLMTCVGILSSGLGPLFGAFRDRSGSYKGPIIVTGLLQALGAVFYTLGLISRRNARRKCV